MTTASVHPLLNRPRDLRAGFDAEVNDLQGSGLLYAGEQWAPARFFIGEHTDPVWEWYLQIHGVTRWSADGRVWKVRPGDLLGVAPHTRHAMAEAPSGNHHFFFAAYDPAPGLGRHGDLINHWPTSSRIIHLSNAQSLFDPFAQLVHELTGRHEFVHIGLRLAIDRLSLEIARQLQRRTGPRAGVLHPAVQQVKAIIERNYAQQLKLHDLADSVGLAPNYLSALFSKDLARSPHRYQVEQRMIHARRLLTSSDLSITAIAGEVGFSSGQHFSRTFRQMMNTTPRAFRMASIDTHSQRVEDEPDLT